MENDLPVVERVPPRPTPLGKAAKSLPELVAEHVLRSIMAGDFAPGSRLKEIDLAQEHAVSRATVRQALAILEKQRFVARVPRYGARVTAVPNEEIYEIFELRSVLLGLAARRAAELAPDSALDGIEAIVAEIEALASKRNTDPHAFAQRSAAAQQTLIETSASRWLVDLYEQLANVSVWQVMRGSAASFVTQERRQESARDWRRVANALRKRDAQRADEAARKLLENSARRVREQLEK